MQIIFKIQKPKDLKGTLIYERTIKQTEVDELDNIFFELASEISSYFSIDSSNIEFYQNIGLNDFHIQFYNTKKSIELTLVCKELSENNEKSLYLDIYFDSADSIFINEKIK
jgi:hypothetical protein